MSGQHHRHGAASGVRLAEVRAADSNPLAFAVAENDRRTIAMVVTALETRRLRLAYQPVVIAADPSRVAFYEGLMRVIDPIPGGSFRRAISWMRWKPMNSDVRLIVSALEMGLTALARIPGCAAFGEHVGAVDRVSALDEDFAQGLAGSTQPLVNG